MVTINVQAASAQVASSGANMGLASFDSTEFGVDANGFVTLAGAGATETLTGNSGGAVSPTANNINTLGTGSITIAGNPGTSTLTTQLTGLTNHAVQIGAGTATLTQLGPTATIGQVLQSAGAAADPAFSTATYPLTTTINQILYSSAANTVTGLATANRAVLTTTATGVPQATALATDGQLIIGSTAGAPAAATLTAGTGISITNGSNSISIAINGGVVGETITGNSGGALSPTAGNWNILGASTAAGTSPVTTSGAVSTLTVNVQKSQAIAATDATKVGLANFDSAAFDVDANGFVQLNGGGIAATSFDVQANTAPGTDPVVPSAAGLVTVNGAAVANHSVVLETRSRAANAYNLEVQYATSAAATDATKSGVAHFNSAQFSVDANGFVATSGTGVINTITGDTGGALSPTAGNFNILGGPGVTTTGAGSTLTINSVVYTDQPATTTIASDSGSFCSNGGNIILNTPASPTQGEVLEIICTTANAVAVDVPVTHFIRIGSLITTAGGTVTSTAIGDALKLRFRTSDLTWYTISSMGTWLVA